MHTYLAQLQIVGDATTVTVPDPAGFRFTNAKLGTIVTAGLQYVFAAAGIILLLMIISAGFELLTSAGDSKKMDAGRQRLTNAVIGFFIIFVSFWIVQIAGRIFGVQGIINIFG
jgi:hypothetical protein